MSLESVRQETVGALDRLLWQTHDVVDLLVRPSWGTTKHGYDRLLYGVVMNTMALADRLSFYRAPATHQTVRLRALFSEMGADPEAAAVTVQMWRHSLVHTGDPLPFTDTGTGVKYLWLLHWGEEHLPREEHLTFSHGPEVRTLAFGALHAAADLYESAERLLAAAEDDEGLAHGLVEARALLLEKQSRDLNL